MIDKRVSLRVTFDAEADAMYVYFSSDEIESTEPLTDDLLIDRDADGRIVGLEILDARRQMSEELIARLIAQRAAE